MRGMTNLGLYSGIAINASVEEKTVYGDEIFPGNFVEYKQESSYDDFGLNIYKAVEIENDYVVAKTNAGITLFKANDRLNPLYTYSGYTVKDFAVLGNDIYVTNGSYVIKLHIENETISFVKGVSISIYGNANIIEIFKNKVIVFSIYVISRDTKLLWDIYDLDLNEVNNNLDSPYSMSTSSTGIKVDFAKSSENFLNVFIYKSGYYGSIISFYFSEENKLVEENSASQDREKAYFITSNNDDVFYLLYDYSYQYYYIDICCYNVNGGSVQTLFSFNGIKQCYIPSNLFDGKLLILADKDNYFSDNLKLMKLDVVSKAMQVLDTIGGVSLNPESIPFVSSKGVICINSSGHTIINYYFSSKENPVISQHTTKATVMNFSGEGNPIGVAKTGGIENEEIEVYVPMV